ncbi:MAG: flagellar protein FliT [Phycisphaeraceae bacterium]|nr:flagellar protein FliT [Phycisphaeraceae bacterium]
MTARQATPDAATREWSPADDPRRWLDAVSGLVSAQCELCREIEAMGDDQSRMVQEDRTEDLISLLAKRQKLVDRLGALGGELAPLRRKWEVFEPRLSPSQRATVTGLADQLAGLIDRISRRDESDRLCLEERRGRIAAELGGVSVGRGAVSAYLPAENRFGGSFHDGEA